MLFDFFMRHDSAFRMVNVGAMTVVGLKDGTHSKCVVLLFNFSSSITTALILHIEAVFSALG